MVASSESSLWVIVYTNLAVLLLWGYGKSGGGGERLSNAALGPWGSLTA